MVEQKVPFSRNKFGYSAQRDELCVVWLTAAMERGGIHDRRGLARAERNK